MHFDDKPIHIMIISIVVFIVLNLIENIIYYNSGKHGIDKDLNTHLQLPNKKEIIYIITIMIVFALAQGFFTIVLSYIF